MFRSASAAASFLYPAQRGLGVVAQHGGQHLLRNALQPFRHPGIVPRVPQPLAQQAHQLAGLLVVFFAGGVLGGNEKYGRLRAGPIEEQGRVQFPSRAQEGQGTEWIVSSRQRSSRSGRSPASTINQISAANAAWQPGHCTSVVWKEMTLPRSSFGRSSSIG